jgi:starch synthase
VDGELGSIFDVDPLLRAHPMKVLFATMEVHPFSKVGGLGDVAAALSLALFRLDTRVTLITPWYRTLPDKAPAFRQMRVLHATELSLGEERLPVRFLAPETPEEGPELVFVEEPRYLSLDGPYLSGADSPDYAREPQGSIAFSKAVAYWALHNGKRYDVVHLNEHNTALAAPLLRRQAGTVPVVLTVHNFGHQGVYDPWVLPLLGLPLDGFYPMGPLEFYGKVNFLKAGIMYSDAITTVSETYRQEVMTQYEFGWGLEGVLRSRADRFIGIINGIDGDEWSPRTSPHIMPHYSGDRLEGKRKVKERLLVESELPATLLDRPLCAVILRLVEQKGIDLILAVADRLLGNPVGLIVMGKGRHEYERAFLALQQRHPQTCRAIMDYDERLAHRITAGADLFLMPSRFEPCGLNQMYSLAFGTVPVVRNTGGLADSVIDVRHHPDYGTGFTFRDPTPGGLWKALEAALEQYKDKREWQRIMRRGMRESHAWERSARTYLTLYRDVIDGAWGAAF